MGDPGLALGGRWPNRAGRHRTAAFTLLALRRTARRGVRPTGATSRRAPYRRRLLQRHAHARLGQGRRPVAIAGARLAQLASASRNSWRARPQGTTERRWRRWRPVAGSSSKAPKKVVVRSRRAAPNGSSGPSSRQRPAMSAAASDWSATWSSSPSALARASATSSAELDPSSGEVRVSGCHRTSASRPSGSPPSRAGKAARPGETPPRSVLGTRRGQRAEEHHFGPDRPTRQDGIRPGGGDGWRVAEGEAGEDAEAKRWVCPLEPFPSEAGAATGRGHEGDRGGRAKRGDRPTERDQVAAGRGRHRDHAAEALEVRGRAVVPEDRAQAGFDPARRPAASRRDLPRAQARRAPARPGPHTSSPARAQGAADRLERVCGPPSGTLLGWARFRVPRPRG